MPDELSTDEALRVLGEIAEVNRETMLILSGGEPLLAELPEAIRSSRDVGARVLMVFFLVCTGRGQDLVDLTPEEYERALSCLVQARDDGVMIRPRYAPTFRRVLAQTTPDSILLTGA